jgi:hypothetical protein
MGRNDFPLTVIADDRERKGEVIKFLSEMKNVSVYRGCRVSAAKEPLGCLIHLEVWRP